jgi:hydroxyacylglutathione hydrolase
MIKLKTGTTLSTNAIVAHAKALAGDVVVCITSNTMVIKLTRNGLKMSEVKRAIRCLMIVQMLYCIILVKLLSLFPRLKNGVSEMAVIIDEKDVRIERLILSPYETNCYIVVCKKTQQSLVVDAPADASSIIAALEGTKPKYILLTHDHYDHTGTLTSLRARLKVPLAAHTADSASLNTPPEIFLKDSDVLNLGKFQVVALHTPGHTPGSLCFRIGKYLIAGDTIFPGGPGNTASPDDFRQIAAAINAKILILSDETVIYPGHGDATTVKKSREEYAIFASREHSADLCGDVIWLAS